ncbi:hypothetical protein J4H86_20725 [Spiractinospora alimapuensis]|uniref:DUF6716 putative glycosyltransferase n=1 Tax=Spiractinospora alimapuensis TaxID=2820884 RepID=UPI001F319DB3|nr:DUF6716 putative glycosyltransferase [Spiractinospora alimapuensis]QVQ51225.1 hypothetical protein J4H86_20725 [Spiractinospora alimapuensis]
MTDRGDVHVLAIADSDSYLKWSAGLLEGLPAGWSAELVVVRTPIAPSATQMRGAVAGARVQDGLPRLLSVRELRRVLRRSRPDVVLLACTGPVVDVLAADIRAVSRPRPVLMTGLPGISVPATEKAWTYRGPVDLFVVHSSRELADFRDIGAQVGVTGSVALATLPFLPTPATCTQPNQRDTDPATEESTARRRVVFATQAKVPVERSEREEVLRALADLAVQRPDLDVVVKLRARAHEQQTHRERHHYETLWDDLAAAGDVPADAVRFVDGSMREHLANAAGFVTVSSTAALEAIAQDIPVIVLSDFGVNAEMINVVFEDSGALGTLEDLRDAAFRTPDPQWSAANYFHPHTENDWADSLRKLVAHARSGPLPDRPAPLDAPTHRPARRRARLRLTVPPTALRTIGRLRRRVRKLRG